MSQSSDSDLVQSGDDGVSLDTRRLATRWFGVVSFGFFSGVIEAFLRLTGGFTTTIANIGWWLRFNVVGICFGIPCGEESLTGIVLGSIRVAARENIQWVTETFGALSAIVVAIEIALLTYIVILGARLVLNLVSPFGMGGS